MPKYHRKKQNNYKKTLSNNYKPKIWNEQQEQFKEIDVGITKYIDQNREGFSGIIKTRYSDFQVNEINLDEEIVKLTDTTIPKDFIEKKSDINLNDIIDSPIEEIPQTIWEKIKELTNNTDKTTKIELDVDKLTKEQRKKIHDTIRQMFYQKLISNTMDINDKKLIVFKKYDNKSDDNKRVKWPENKGEYVYFLVYKEALDTMEASLKIADAIRIPATNLTYAGIKDRRAKTTQTFCVFKVPPWKLLNKTKSIRNLRIGNLSFKSKPLKLGDLAGNHFRIALRNVQATDDLINQAMTHLKSHGFINYYGLQRFGNNKQVPTYEIGNQLMLGNWKEACDIILKLTDSDDPNSDITKAKQIYAKNGDVVSSLNEFNVNKNRCIEWKLLDGLNTNGTNDYVNSLEKIPRNTRLLYIHSFQSLIFNHVASYRIDKLGFKPVVGDLVLLDEKTVEVDADEDTNCKQDVKLLDEDDCKNYSIYDVVLPLPGYDIIYPENTKSFYQEILSKYGLTLDMAKQKVQTYNVSGTYRKLLSTVNDLKWNIMHYNEPNKDLIRSDLDELKNIPEPTDEPNGQYKAVLMEFSLKPSNYATMVLREVLKMDTSSATQAKLNDYFKKQSTQIATDTGESSLLNDKEKYEAFKQSVFGKRNAETTNMDDNVDVESKKLKIDV